MAEIYLARARGIQGFEKFVVLKRILPQYAENETFVRLFLNEARVAATLDHPNIASVYDIDQQEGVYFFTMEYLHGEDLRLILKELGRRNLKLPLAHAVSVALGVAAGLHAAHEKSDPDGRPLGIVHRDVSPSNVVVTYAGGVKLVDFGIAKATAQSEFTGTGSLKGKVAYMSPEQCRSLPLDRRSDVFALGVLLYELTTQSRLFRADTDLATLQLVLEGEIPRPKSRLPGFPAGLEEIVMHALERDVDKRFQTARELGKALEAFAHRTGVALSSTQLGDWMERTFGPKPEAWRGLGLTGEFTPHRDGPLLGLRSGTPRPEARAELTAATRAASPTTRRLELGRRRRLLAATGLAALLCTAGGFGLSRLLAPVPPASPPPAMLPVSAAGPAAFEPVSAPAPVAVLPRPAAGTGATPAPPPVPSPPKRRPDRRPAARPVDFSAVFARRQADLEKCFYRYPEDVAKADHLSVRFQTGADGRVVTADVLPNGVARTELGACIAGVAAQTQFPPQPAPVAFSIPVKARRVQGAGRP
jgi:tRNA A-37 threonylcarbamoyl transferase component Bud32